MRTLQKTLVGGSIAGGALLSLLALIVLHPRVKPVCSTPVFIESTAGGDPPAVGATPGERTPATESPEVLSPEANAEELRALAKWMEGLSREELLRLSNAEFGFEKSALVEELRGLTGDWVVTELGRLALLETDPLVKAVLVAGLFKGAGTIRLDDPRMIEQISRLLPELSIAAEDPFHSARFMMFAAFGACLRQEADFAALVLPHLEGSDNPDVLVRGYLFLGETAGADDVLARAVTDHPSAAGRFGALEGLRSAGLAGRIPPDEIAHLGIAALARETEARNRTLLVEMIATAGGEEGLRALQSIVARGEHGLVGAAASMLAVKMDPERAQATLEKALAAAELSTEDRASLYQALGAVPGERSGERLLAAVHDEDLPEGERLQALRGLWNRPEDEGLRRELADLVDGEAPAALRSESLRLLAFSGGEASAIDTKALAVSDRDPEVRCEAVMLSALKPDADSRSWLEERLLNDRSPDVQAAALGALVVQARYTGDGEFVKNHLERVKGMTDDPEIRSLVERGERMVAEYDPRRVELELRRDAEFYRDVAIYTSGAARQAMQRQSEYYRRMVEALTALAPRASTSLR